MKSYILLRNNRESGPYSLRELKTIGITSSDLIWIDGESTSWNHPVEYAELKQLVSAGILIPLQAPPEPKHFSSVVESYPAASTFHDADMGSIRNESPYASYLNDKDDHFHWESKKTRRSLQDLTSSFFGMGVLLIGVMMCAFVVKKLVDHFEFDPYVASAQAVEISRETLPTSVSANSAKTIVQSGLVSTATNANNLVEEPVQVMPAVIKKVEVKKQALVDTQKAKTNPLQLTSAETTAANEEPESKQPEEKTEAPIEKKAPSVAVSANDYKVGMFGGISELELSVNNQSSMEVAKATVEIEFLKPNGSVVKSQTISVENIAPGGTKKISVPSSSRGVKVRYRVVSVD